MMKIAVSALTRVGAEIDTALMRRMLAKLFGGTLRGGLPSGCAVALGLLLGSVVIPGACRRSEPPPAPGTPASQAPADESNLLRLRNVALAYLEAERHADAAKAFDDLIQLIPKEPMVHANRGLIALRENKMQEATTFLDAAAQLAPDDPDIATLRSQAAVYEGNDQIARTLLEHAVEKNPDHLRTRWALVELLKRDPHPGAAGAALTHLNTVLEHVPRNVVIRLALARQLVERGELHSASEHLVVLDEMGIASDSQARQFLNQAKDSLEQGDATTARSSVIALDNVLKPSRAWQDSLVELKGPPVPVADPIWDFLAYRIPQPETDPRMLAVTFCDISAALGLQEVEAESAIMLVMKAAESPSIVSVAGEKVEIRRRAADGRYELIQRFHLETQQPRASVRVVQLLATDWNNDRRMDLVCGLSDGSVWLSMQDDEGSWQTVPGEPGLAPLLRPTEFHVLLPWDADQDGDLDILVGRSGVRAALLRNNGDGTFAETARELGIARDSDAALINAAIADLDEDGDVDLITVNAQRRIIRFDNQRSGKFAPNDLEIFPGPVVCVTAADFDNDGWLDLAFVTSDGSCRIGTNHRGVAFDVRTVGAVERGAASGTMIRDLDFDNDGWLDFLVVADGRPHLFRNTGGLAFRRTQTVLPPEVGDVKSVQVVDHDSDGDLDLFVVLQGGRCTVWDNE